MTNNFRFDCGPTAFRAAFHEVKMALTKCLAWYLRLITETTQATLDALSSDALPTYSTSNRTGLTLLLAFVAKFSLHFFCEIFFIVVVGRSSAESA